MSKIISNKRVMGAHTISPQCLVTITT